MSTDRLARARAALDRGDVLVAYDEAATTVIASPDDLEARYLAVLALARSGASRRAAAEAERLVRFMDSRGDVPTRLLEDAAAVSARIAKDRALAAPASLQRAFAAEAAKQYEAIAGRYGGSYACINAASLCLLAGQLRRSRVLAQRARDLVAHATVEGAEADYWRAVTSAEANLLLGDLGSACAALGRASELPGANLAARASTRHQLEFIAVAMGVDPAFIAILRVPGVLHYCGHAIGIFRVGVGERFPPHFEGEARAQVTEHLEQRDIGIAFGSLASGADIIVAEALLERGAELNVVLPFDTTEFKDVSVRPAGTEWVTRFERCLDGATSVTHACDSAYLGDNELFSYAARIAMGHARNRAAILAVEAEQLAVWDGLPSRGPGGTADDIATWRAAGGSTHVISLPSQPPSPATTRDKPYVPSSRSVHAILFADFRGFSRLRDEHYAAMLDAVYEPLAKVIKSYDSAALWLNSWGDAIQIVFSDVASAGRCALELQQASSSIDRATAGLPTDLELRIGLHAGPVIERRDPFRDAPGWWGREITRAARIEPRTPEGEVYATDAYAALIAMEPDSGLSSEYVGRVTTAKNFETIPMYRMRRTEQSALASD